MNTTSDDYTYLKCQLLLAGLIVYSYTYFIIKKEANYDPQAKIYDLVNEIFNENNDYQGSTLCYISDSLRPGGDIS